MDHEEMIDHIMQSFVIDLYYNQYTDLIIEDISGQQVKIHKIVLLMMSDDKNLQFVASEEFEEKVMFEDKILRFLGSNETEETKEKVKFPCDMTIVGLLVRYIYCGVVLASRDNLDKLIQLGQLLKIKGLEKNNPKLLVEACRGLVPPKPFKKGVLAQYIENPLSANKIKRKKEGKRTKRAFYTCYTCRDVIICQKCKTSGSTVLYIALI